MTLQAIHLSPAWILRTQKPHGFPKHTDDTQMASLPASQGGKSPQRESSMRYSRTQGRPRLSAPMSTDYSMWPSGLTLTEGHDLFDNLIKL